MSLIKTYNEFCCDWLKDHKTGRSETTLNHKASDIILDIRKKYGYGACHIEEILKKTRFWY